MNIEKVREEFEARFPVPNGVAWDESEYKLIRQKKCTLLSHLFYLGRWETWQASRAALVIELPKIVGYEGAYDSLKEHEFCLRVSDVDDADEVFGLCRSIETREAIEAAGVKWK